MKKIFNLLLLLLAFNVSAQYEHATKVELKDVEELPVALIDTRVLITDSATGEIKYVPLSTIKALGMGTEPDLSNYVTKDLPEDITGKKTWDVTDNQAIQIIKRGINTGLNIDNLGDGVGLTTDNRLDGNGIFQWNYGSGANQKVISKFDSTGDAYVLLKEFVGGVNTQVFKIDNVGNTMLQELEIEQASENTLTDEVLVRGADNKVGFVSKASLGGAIVKDGAGYIIADRTDGALHGAVGTGAFDLSYNTSLQSAIGQYSLLGGLNNTSEDNVVGGGKNNRIGSRSVGGGENNIFGQWCVGGGFNNTLEGGNVGGGANNTYRSYSIGGGVSNTFEQYSIGGGQQNNFDKYSIGGGVGNEGGQFSSFSGRSVSAPSYGETAHGSYNTEYTPQSTTSFNINDRLFSLGNGTDVNNHSNALEVWKDGRTILDKLEVRTLDQDNTATKLLVADNTGKVGYQEKSDLNLEYIDKINTFNPNNGTAQFPGGVQGIQLTSNSSGSTGFPSAYGSIAHFGFASSKGRAFTMWKQINKDSYFLQGYSPTGAPNGFKEIYTTGSTNLNAWVLYGNTSTTVQSISANTPTVLNNNGGYYNNNKFTDLYNTTTQQLDLTEAKQNDNLSIVLEVEIETLANSQVVYMQYRGAIGSANEWSINLTNEVYYKNQGTRNMVCKFDVPLEFVQDITNPAEITIVSDGALNAKTKYHYLKIN